MVAHTTVSKSIGFLNLVGKSLCAGAICLMAERFAFCPIYA